jgi:tetratricopeptide (TPR) repeat protein
LSDLLFNLGIAYFFSDLGMQAAFVLGKAHSLMMLLDAPDQSRLYECRRRLAECYCGVKRKNEAKALMEKSIAECKAEPGEAMVPWLFGLAEAHHKDNFERARALYLQALRIEESANKADPASQACLLIRLANAEAWLSNLKQAKKYALRALAILEKNFPKDHPFISVACLWLGSLGHYSLSNKAHLRGIRIREKEFGADHYLTMDLVASLSISYERQGRYKDAVVQLRRMLGALDKRRAFYLDERACPSLCASAPVRQRGSGIIRSFGPVRA